MVKLKNFESFLYGQQDSHEMDKEIQSMEHNMMLSRSLVEGRAGPQYTGINRRGLEAHGLQAASARLALSPDSSFFLNDSLQRGVTGAAADEERE